MRKDYLFYIGLAAGAALLWQWHQRRVASAEQRGRIFGRTEGKFEFIIQQYEGPR